MRRRSALGTVRQNADVSVHSQPFPLSYRWFISRGLTSWQPWYFIDDQQSLRLDPDFSKNDFAVRAFKTETRADFDVYLFARRQDMDDFAFFVVKDGKIEDKVVTIHLTFAKKLELKAPLQYGQVTRSFVAWMREDVIPDVEDWMNEDDLPDVDDAR